MVQVIENRPYKYSLENSLSQKKQPIPTIVTIHTRLKAEESAFWSFHITMFKMSSLQQKLMTHAEKQGSMAHLWENIKLNFKIC